MPKFKYKDFNFRSHSHVIIEQANSIIVNYQIEGYDLTLRQLYYQFVARGIIPNNDIEYKKLGSIINDGRLAGLIDWEAIIDRTRPNRGNSHWENPQELINACAEQFRLDSRTTQENYIEIWIEKDALLGILENICKELDVPYLSCRGYVSQSSMWEAAQRFIREEEKGRNPILIHLGDHDPSGIDMSRDIQDRLEMFESSCQVQRIALIQDQIDEYNPPPNPTKLTDSRCQSYIDQYGEECWELDALEPRVITNLIKDAVGGFTDENKRQDIIKAQTKDRLQMMKVANNWENIVKIKNSKMKGE